MSCTCIEVYAWLCTSSASSGSRHNTVPESKTQSNLLFYCTLVPTHLHRDTLGLIQGFLFGAKQEGGGGVLVWPQRRRGGRVLVWGQTRRGYSFTITILILLLPPRLLLLLLLPLPSPGLLLLLLLLLRHKTILLYDYITLLLLLY